MKAAALFLFFALAAGAQTAGTDQTGGVTGVVTDAVTKMPVKKTVVTINPMGNIGGRNQTMQSAVTDASGAFTITNLQAGHYRIQFQQQNYPQARFGGVTKNVDVKPGESTGPVTVELIPGASISGHVTDEDGDPLQGCNVQVHPAKHLEQGVQMSGSLPSNDDGEFRAFGIAPGKYVLSAQCHQTIFQARQFSAGPDPPPTRGYQVQYYPLTSDSKSAEVVELTPGNEKSGIDFHVVPTAVTQVHGIFSPGGADWHGANLQILLASPDRRSNVGASIDPVKGTFEFRQVFPGSYILSVFTNGGDDRIGAFQRIDVSDRPIALTLELRHAIDLTGKVEIASSGNTANPVTPNQISIMMTPDSQVGMVPQPTQVSGDGTFTIKGVLPGIWHLQANGPMSFIKSAWLGSTDVTNAPLDLSAGASGTLRIVVSTNTATIRGSAAAGQQIFAQRIDDDMPYRSNRSTMSDQNGQYTFTGLTPGKYRVLVMDSIGPMPEEGGQEITVHEGETIMADLKPPAAP
jgi:hypothetical protein